MCIVSSLHLTLVQSRCVFSAWDLPIANRVWRPKGCSWYKKLCCGRESEHVLWTGSHKYESSLCTPSIILLLQVFLGEGGLIKVDDTYYHLAAAFCNLVPSRYFGWQLPGADRRCHPKELESARLENAPLQYIPQLKRMAKNYCNDS